MKKHTDQPGTLRNSVEDFFSTADYLLQNGRLSEKDQHWLEKELEEMEKKLKAYKRTHTEKAEVA